MTRPAATTALPWVVALGVLCRVRQYAADTSLWHDESFVALNILHTPLRGLLGRLDWNEPSPPGFLALEQLIVRICGSSEYALRLLPLVAGIAALLAFAGLARRAWRDDAVCLWCVTLFAASAKLIEQCNLVKHFTFDSLATIALTYTAVRLWDASPTTRGVWSWAALAVLAPWCSYASVFVVVATAALLTTRALRHWHAPLCRTFTFATMVVLASLALLVWTAMQQRTGAVLDFWAQSQGFPDASSLGRLLGWFARALLGVFDHFWQPAGLLTAGCVGAAAIAVWQDGGGGLLVLLWLPVLLALIASFLHLWPFGGNQHMVFAASAILLCAGRGAEIIRSALAPWRPRAAAALVAVFLSPGVSGALYHLIVPRYRHELRPVIRFMQAHTVADDVIIPFDPATLAYYTGRDPRGEIVPPDARARVWIITPRSSRGDVPVQVQHLLDDLRQRRRLLQQLETFGAAAYLFGPVGADAAHTS